MGNIDTQCNFVLATNGEHPEYISETVMPHQILVTVYDRLTCKKGLPARFFVLTKDDVRRLIVESHMKWLKGLDWKRPNKVDSMHWAPGLPSHTPCEDNWQLIFHRMTA